MIKRKICVITGTRAEYGLLYLLMREIEKDKNVELQIIATGMHVSPVFGNTYQQIEKDGFKINKKVDLKLMSDSEVGISKSMGYGMIGFADSLKELCPDLIVVVGDRFEIFSAVSVAMIAKIPVAHIHGGEITEGAFDDAIRHSITKMSHLHFTANEEYKNRVIQLGEEPNRVFNVGGLGADNINQLKLLSKVEFEKASSFQLAKKNILVTFHPVTLENLTSKAQFQELLDAIRELKDTKIIFTKANSDTGGKIINTMIDDYVLHHKNSVAFISMGRLNYLSALQFVDAVVGNSSSGLLEAPSFKIATIDIGDRQKGRIKGSSVISCLPNKASIGRAFIKSFSEEFQGILSEAENPYGSGGASKKIFNIIRSSSLDGIIKKKFNNINLTN